MCLVCFWYKIYAVLCFQNVLIRHAILLFMELGRVIYLFLSMVITMKKLKLLFYGFQLLSVEWTYQNYKNFIYVNFFLPDSVCWRQTVEQWTYLDKMLHLHCLELEVVEFLLTYIFIFPDKMKESFSVQIISITKQTYILFPFCQNTAPNMIAQTIMKMKRVKLYSGLLQ